MRANPEGRLTKLLLVCFFALVIGYAYFEGRGALYGPSISVEELPAATAERLVTIRGSAQRISSLSMNGSAVPVTEAGDFSERYVLAPGYNRIVLEAGDRYGKSTVREIEIVLLQDAADASPRPAASSPPSASSTLEVAPQE